MQHRAFSENEVAGGVWILIVETKKPGVVTLDACEDLGTGTGDFFHGFSLKQKNDAEKYRKLNSDL